YPYESDASQGGQMWSDNDRFQPGKRFGLMNFDSIELKAGKAVSYDIAFFLVEEDSFNIKQIAQNCLSIKQVLSTKNLVKNTQKDLTFTEKISVYPNPVKAGEKLRIDFGFDKPINMRVISSDGREMIKLDLHNFNNYIILPFDFTDGVYFLEYQTLNTKQYIKFVINQ
ncbi:MAG: T9SS type A sorting domain-containing protein, partial [Bacteroidia bacterium]|nr:T9SS type A sorting domain-containing protein [Bacteroidia bacterium]